MLLEKKIFRKMCKTKLEQSSKVAKLYKDKQVEKKLYYIVNRLKPKSILLYLLSVLKL